MHIRVDIFVTSHYQNIQNHIRSHLPNSVGNDIHFATLETCEITTPLLSLTVLIPLTISLNAKNAK